ncbi:MAG: tetratricopeptide repeat protein [Proteobacteria bacterium]|nr:tetratricopeptide repeat protein [Pseudomonadota bacterium]
MTNTRQHGETDAPARGIDAVIQDALEWVQRNAGRLAVLVAGLAAIGITAAVVYELDRRAQSAAQSALHRIEAEFAAGMGSPAQEALIPEPANREQATRAREAALEALERFVVEHAGSEALAAAQIRAAEVEADLGRFAEADARLERLTGELTDQDPRKGIALWLRGYVLEELEEPVRAAQLYEAAGRLMEFPPRAQAWLAAGQTYSRAGRYSEAVRAYTQAMSANPELRLSDDLQREVAALDAIASAEDGPQLP